MRKAIDLSIYQNEGFISMLVDLGKRIESLLNAPISHLNYIDPGHESTNDVYEGETPKGHVIIKILKDPHMKGVFWKGLNYLFGITPAISIAHQLQLTRDINAIGVIPAPNIIQFDSTSNNVLHKPYVILEKMPGSSVSAGSDLAIAIAGNPDITAQLGRFLAETHKKTYDFYGNLNLNGPLLEHFPEQLAETIVMLAGLENAKQNTEVQRLLPYMLSQVRKMAVPTSASLIMLDLWPSQFLATEKKITALIDFETYVIGPVGLELCLLELWLKKRRSFKEAYLASGLSWPDYEDQREVYRFFLYLLYDCPPMGLQACLDAKKFALGDRLKSRLVAPKLKPISNIFTPYSDDEDD